MFKRYWIIALAAGLVALSGQSQENQDQTERATQEQEASPNQLSVPLPVVIVEAEEAAIARERAEQEAKEREQKDLIAQEGMNAATQRMAKYAFAQTVLIALGTCALVWTLCEARKTTRIASQSIDVAARQSRCYIEPTAATFMRPKKHATTLLTGFSNIKIECINHGSSIATNVECLCEIEVIDLNDLSSGKTMRWREFSPDYRAYHKHVAPNSEFSISLSLDAVEEIERTPWDTDTLTVIRGAVYYQDVFGDRFRSGFILLRMIGFEHIEGGKEIPLGMSKHAYGVPAFEPVSTTKDQAHS